MLLKFLEPLDIFKINFNLYFRERKQQSSIIGIIFSIFIFTFLIYQFANSELFKKHSPNVITQSFLRTHSEAIDFNYHRPLVLGITDSQLRRIADPSLFKLVAVYFNNYNMTMREIEQCTYDHLKGSMNLSYFNAVDAQKGYCFSDPNITLEGYLDEYNYKFLQIYLYPCDNITSNNTCKSPEEIREALKGKIFSIAYPSVQIDANDYENPLKITYDPIAIYLDSSILKSNIVYLKNVEVSTDDGWLFSEMNVWQTSGIALDYYRLDYGLRINEGDALVDWKFFASKQKLKSSRMYQKLPETLASLAGMANLFIFIGFLITNVFMYMNSLKYILNKLYYFDYEEDHDKGDNNNNNSNNNHEEQKLQNKEILKDPPKKSGFLKINLKPPPIEQNDEPTEKKKENEGILIDSPHPEPKYLKQDSFILENFSKEMDNSDDHALNYSLNSTPIPKTGPLEKIKIIEMTKLDSINSPQGIKQISTENKLSFSLMEFIKYYFKKLFSLKKGIKEKLIHKAESIYIDELDVTNILKKLHEIENIKLLFLNQDQMNLFDYLTKPYVSLNNNKSEKRLTKAAITKSKFLESYKRCDEEKNTNQISKKLVELCDHTLIK